MELRTLDALRLLPGSTVSGESLLLGKKVDAFCVLHRALAPPFRIAVECKDWSAQLTRKQCSDIVSEYRELLDAGVADQLLLVTQNDIVPNARLLFCGPRLKHVTITELLRESFDSGHLLSNIDSLYEQDGLDLFYQRPSGAVPDLEFCAKNYDLIYNDFMDFAVDSFGAAAEYLRVREEWSKYQPAGREAHAGYTPKRFDQCLGIRTRRKGSDLEDAVLDWVIDGNLKVQIALLGSYGTGKSSFARRIAHRCGQLYRDARSLRIPLLIELKEFGSHQDVKGLITHELVNRHRCSNGSFEAFDALNRAGHFVIILDGFDEMKQGMTLDSLVFNFNQLALLCHPNSKVLLCGRPTLFESQTEQNRVLNGGQLVLGNASARYAQVEILPLASDAVCVALLEYARHRDPEALKRVEQFVAIFLQILEKDSHSSVIELVSRPVHLPMLVSLLKRKFVAPADLTRSLLYSDFVDAIIERESFKRNVAFQTVYPTEARRTFAKRLAVEMWGRGEQRSIRTTEIPEYVFQEFLSPGRSVESVRRDLVASCFFERKSPDILFAAHKSFLEYLVAEAIVDAIVAEDAQSHLALDLALTDEVASFALEIIGKDDWQSFLLPNRASRGLLRRVTKLIAQGTASLPDGVEDDIYCVLESIDDISLQRIITCLGRSGHDMSDVAREIIELSLGHRSDLVAVEAFRVLDRLGWAPDGENIREKVGRARIGDWLRKKWVIPPQAPPRELKGKERNQAQKSANIAKARFEGVFLPSARDGLQAQIFARTLIDYPTGKELPPDTQSRSAAMQHLIGQLSKLSALEIAELSKLLEERWGVSAAAALAVAAPGGTGGPTAPATDEQTEFDVILTGDGSKKINTIKEVRAITNLGLSEAKMLVESLPKAVKECVSKDEAEKIKEKFEEFGATIEIK